MSDKPEIINGWTISQRGDLFIAVSNGIQGYGSKVKSYVETFARTTKPNK